MDRHIEMEEANVACHGFKASEENDRDCQQEKHIVNGDSVIKTIQSSDSVKTSTISSIPLPVSLSSFLFPHSMHTPVSVSFPKKYM